MLGRLVRWGENDKKEPNRIVVLAVTEFHTYVQASERNHDGFQPREFAVRECKSVPHGR